MGATMTTVNAMLKEIYEPDVHNQMNNDAIGFKRIEKSSEGIENNVGGKYVVFPIKIGRNHGIGARNETEALPTPGQQKSANARVSVKFLYGGINLTGQTMRLAAKQYQTFANTLDDEMTGLKTDLTKDLNFQFYGDGTGVRANVTADAANTITVDNIQYLEQDMMIDVYDTTLATPRIQNRQITNINSTTKVVTYSGADGSASIVATDKVVRTGNVNREMTGLSAIVKDTGTLYNVDPNTVGLWKAVVNANGGSNRALTEALMIRVADDIRTNGSYPTVVFCSYGVRRAYYNLLKTDRRFVNTQKFDGGFEGLAFATDKGDIPVVTDPDCPFNRMYFVNEKEITLYREDDFGWMDEDGDIMQRVIGFDAYEARMFMYSEVGTHRRNAHGILADLTEG